MPRDQELAAKTTEAPSRPVKAAARARKRGQAIGRQRPPVRPGRPTAARVEAINRAILAAARKQFRKMGFEATPMEAIAAAAKVSKGTLYARYPNKEALLRAVMEERIAAFSAEGQRDRGPLPADLRQRLKTRARQMMEFCCSGKLDMLQRIFSGGPSMHELRRKHDFVGHVGTIKVIAQDIVDGSAEQPIDIDAATRIAEILMAAIYGWWQSHQVRRVSRDEAFAYAEHAVDVLFAGRAAW